MFKNYEVTGISVNVNGGLLRLDKDQARRRTVQVEHVKADVYRVVSPTAFKHGEVFGYDGELGKAATLVVAETRQPPKSASNGAAARIARNEKKAAAEEAEAKAKAEAEAKAKLGK